MKFNVNVIKFGSNKVSFPNLIGVNLPVSESQCEFSDIKFDI